MAIEAHRVSSKRHHHQASHHRHGPHHHVVKSDQCPSHPNVAKPQQRKSFFPVKHMMKLKSSFMSGLRLLRSVILALLLVVCFTSAQLPSSRLDWEIIMRMNEQQTCMGSNLLKNDLQVWITDSLKTQEELAGITLPDVEVEILELVHRDPTTKDCTTDVSANSLSGDHVTITARVRMSMYEEDAVIVMSKLKDSVQVLEVSLADDNDRTKNNTSIFEIDCSNEEQSVTNLQVLAVVYGSMIGAVYYLCATKCSCTPKSIAETTKDSPNALSDQYPPPGISLSDVKYSQPPNPQESVYGETAGIRCPSCASGIHVNDTFCSHCGQELLLQQQSPETYGKTNGPSPVPNASIPAPMEMESTTHPPAAQMQPSSDDVTGEEPRFSSNDEKLSEKWFSMKSRPFHVVMFLSEIIRRLFMILPFSGFEWEHGLLAIDVLCALYFGFRKQYLPGCVYNHLHAIIYNRQFVKAFQSKSGRFSATKKLLLGLTGVYTIFSVCKDFVMTWCLLQREDKSNRDKGVLVKNIFSLILNFLPMVITCPVVFMFWTLAIFAYFAAIPACLCKLQFCAEKERYESGRDFRGVGQRVGGVFFDRWSKEAVRERKWQQAQQQKKTAKFFLDLASYRGSMSYNIWALFYEHL